jgi:hypothetical protein
MTYRPDLGGDIVRRSLAPLISEPAATTGRSAKVAMSAPVCSGRYPFERQLANTRR